MDAGLLLITLPSAVLVLYHGRSVSIALGAVMLIGMLVTLLAVWPRTQPDSQLTTPNQITPPTANRRTAAPSNTQTLP